MLSARRDSFANGRAASTCGASWNEPCPSWYESGAPPIRIIGHVFDHAFAMPAMPWIIPGPQTVRQAPGRPVR